jgi:hypothetical protein
MGLDRGLRVEKARVDEDHVDHRWILVVRSSQAPYRRQCNRYGCTGGMARCCSRRGTEHGDQVSSVHDGPAISSPVCTGNQAAKQHGALARVAWDTALTSCSLGRPLRHPPASICGHLLTSAPAQPCPPSLLCLQCSRSLSRPLRCLPGRSCPATTMGVASILSLATCLRGLACPTTPSSTAPRSVCPQIGAIPAVPLCNSASVGSDSPRLLPMSRSVP